MLLPPVRGKAQGRLCFTGLWQPSFQARVCAMPIEISAVFCSPKSLSDSDGSALGSPCFSGGWRHALSSSSTSNVSCTSSSSLSRFRSAGRDFSHFSPVGLASGECERVSSLVSKRVGPSAPVAAGAFPFRYILLRVGGSACSQIEPLSGRGEVISIATVPVACEIENGCFTREEGEIQSGLFGGRWRSAEDRVVFPTAAI